MKHIKAVITCVTLLSISNFAAATKVVDCTDDIEGTYSPGDFSDNDYSDDTTACHATDRWQKLGSTWTADNTGIENDASTNDGVSWVTSADGGKTWVENGELTSGGLVKFQFDVTRSTDGNHKYDLLKSWVDWNHDGVWSEDEDIISEKWWKNANSDGSIATSGNVNTDLSTWEGLGTSDGSINSDNNTWVDTSYKTPNNSNQKSNQGYWTQDIYNSSDTTKTFFSENIEIPVIDTLSEIWLRARVVCENSLTMYSDNYNLLSYGYQNQGEVEDHKLTVAKRVDVPEPSALFIFSIGLLTFAFRRKA